MDKILYIWTGYQFFEAFPVASLKTTYWIFLIIDSSQNL